MNENPNQERGADLIESVLRDENWQAMNRALKSEVLGAFQARQRIRSQVRVAGGLLAFAALGACGLHWLSEPGKDQTSMAVQPRISSRKPVEVKYLTDDELVASFPGGSCFIAEIDGKKTLTFIDLEVERQYVASAGQLPSLTR